MKKFIMAMFLVPLAASATTWYVNGKNGRDYNSGVSQSSAKKTIQAAINAAGTLDTIYVASATYRENLSLGKALNLIAVNKYEVIVDGQSQNHCVDIQSDANGFNIDGFVFQNGLATNSGNTYGGGIDCRATGNINNCIFKDNGNSGQYFGGGLEISGGATVIVRNCLFVGNAVKCSGGGVLCEGTATFDHCTIWGNACSSWNKIGGLAVASGGIATIKNSIIWNNDSAEVGSYSGGNPGTLVISHSCIGGGYSGTGNISANPQFAETESFFDLQSSSPCKGSGEGGCDMGFSRSRSESGSSGSSDTPTPTPVVPEGPDVEPDEPEPGDIINVTARQLFPHKKVEICYEVTGGGQGVDQTVSLTGQCEYGNWSAINVFGDRTCTPGLHRVIWDFEADGISVDTSAMTFCVSGGIEASPATPIKTKYSNYDFMTVNSSMTIGYSPFGGEVQVLLDGVVLLSATNSGYFAWQPLSTGNHEIKHVSGNTTWTRTVYVAGLAYDTPPSPNPPMAQDNNISITPTTRNFGVNGNGNAIITSGSGKWTAVASDIWIRLNTTSGDVGYPVAYTVSANTNVEQRTGYVYVSGWTHTITQDGVGGTISPESRNFEHLGGSGTIAVSAANKMVWKARSNVDWLTVTTTSGAGSGSVTYKVAPYNEVSTRQGTLTVAGNTFTVFQYGRRMKLNTYREERNYEAHVIPVTVNALDSTRWSVTPNASWISVVDAGNGKGGDLVTVAIGENPSYRARTGTVTIGTETFTVTQLGRPTEALSFDVSPVNSTASVDGANGLVSVTATPDLPWTATSGANWITIYAATATGAGNGNVVYSASPNPTLFDRTGTVTVKPEAASGLAAKTHTVRQPAATATLSSDGYEFEAAGDACAVDVSCAGIVQWSISESIGWLTVNGSTSRVGPGTVVLQTMANDTVYPRSGTVTIAGKTFRVMQKARRVELEYDTKLFETDGGYESISIHPDGNSEWTAVASDPTWITIFQGDSGTGDGEILYIVSPYVGDGTARTGWIEVGDQKVFVTQRAYDLSIEPNGTKVEGNAGAGEIGVSADIGSVWTAIVTEPWITLVSGYDSGTGSGTVRFHFADNMTGKTRTGKIVVAGEVYTIEQQARMMSVVFNANGGTGGKTFSVSKGVKLGTYLGKMSPKRDGYDFSGWWTAKAGGSRIDASTVVVGDATYYAHWTWASPTCTIQFHANGGSGGKTLTVNTGAELGVSMGKVSPVRDGYAFSGWWTDRTGGVQVGASDVASGDATYYARWAALAPPCPILFHANGGSGGKTLTVAGGAKLGAYMDKVSPKRTGYNFNGWWTERNGGTIVRATDIAAGDATYYAQWLISECTIFFHANGGTGGKTFTVAGGAKLGTYMDKVSPKRDGCTFDGWWTEKTGGIRLKASDIANGDVTCYAHWVIPSCTVFFHANGGTGGKTFTVAGGAKLGTYMDKVSPKRDGCTFDGWWTERNGGTRVSASAVVVDAATYYAHWTVQQPPCTVFFHANGGTGGKTFASVAIGAKLSYYMDQVKPSNGSLVFNGWWTERNGGTQVNSTTVVTGDATYYAHWTAASACVKPVNGSADVAASVALANYYGYAYLADGGEAKMLLTVFGDGKATAVVGGDTVYRGELPILSAPDGATLRVVLEGDVAFGFQQ